MIFIPYIILIFAISCYSYGHLDLNLTLINNAFFLKFVGYLQHLVFFNRPLSTNIYLTLTILLWVAYFFIIFTQKNRQTLPIYAIFLVGFVAALSYPLFTHDLYNYLFHARIVITHHANPHLLPPQVFVGDEWLRFMHWVHNPSAYGYGFTAYMIIPYVLGFTKLSLSLYLYKIMSFGWYLLAIWLIGKIAQNNKLTNPTLAQLLFAFNPLIILEWLINAHNDNMMVTLMLLSWFLFGQGKKLFGSLTFLYAVITKYAAILILPAFFVRRLLGEKPALKLASFVLAIAPFLYHYPTQYQVWYITWIIPFVILSGSQNFLALSLGYAFGGFLTYLPYLNSGFWMLSKTSRELYLFLPALFFWLFWFIQKRMPKIWHIIKI